MKILIINPNKKHDYLANSIIEGLRNYDNIEIYCTSDGNGAINIIDDFQFIEHYKTCDFIFAIWGKAIYNGVPEPKFYLIDKVNGWNKTVYIDGSEYNYTGYKGKTTELIHPLFKEKAKWYFKRECLPVHETMGIVPLPFAADCSYFLNTKLEKSIDVLCSFGQAETGMRKIAIEACNELHTEGYNIITTPVKNYYEHINKSWITVDAHGGGECNARMWQVMANKSCLFAEQYSIVIPNLIPNKDYISWSSKEDLKDKIRNYLNDKKILSSIIQTSYENIIQNHTTDKRITYIFNKIM